MSTRNLLVLNGPKPGSSDCCPGLHSSLLWRGVVAGALFISSLVVSASEEGVRADVAAMSELERATLLLERFPDADELAIGYARNLVDGRPAKRWKSCILKETLEEQLISAGQSGSY
jgi:hypothetical protein